MLEGVFLVSFQSSRAVVGEGVAVFDACGVHGANENHMFRGRQDDGEDVTRLRIEVLYLHGEKYPAFRELSSINLDLAVTDITPEGFRATGVILEAPGIRLRVLGRKLGGLVEDGD